MPRIGATRVGATQAAAPKVTPAAAAPTPASTKPRGGNKPGGGQGGSLQTQPYQKPGGSGSGTQPFQQGGGFWENPGRPIAGVNPYQAGAGKLAGGLPGAGKGRIASAGGYLDKAAGGSDYLRDAMSRIGRYSEGNMPGVFGEATDASRQLADIGRRKVTGENVQSDPAYAAARKAFSSAQMPLIQNAAVQSGLGSSTAMTNALASGQAQYLLPIIQGSLAREERGIDRELGATGQKASNLFGAGSTLLGENRAAVGAGLQGAGQEASNLFNAASGQSGLAGQEMQNILSSINAFSGLGDKYRGIEQEKLDAPYDAQQAKWKEALNAMYGPLGFLGNMGGATSTQSKK
ncbi:MAG: hypothetical protein KAJ06_09200 [Gammaproteobacteria bacterium]|nr:hypothetical protein [Gammaproteobacteria bacterium]